MTMTKGKVFKEKLSALLNEASWIKLLTLPQPWQLFSKTGISPNGTWMPSVSDRKKRIMKVLLMTTYSLKIIYFPKKFLEMEKKGLS